MMIVVDLDRCVRWRGVEETWDDYHREVMPLDETIKIVNALADFGHVVYGYTGKPERLRGWFVKWLVERDVRLYEVEMRDDDDFRNANDIKTGLIKFLLNHYDQVMLIDGGVSLHDRDDMGH